MISRLLTLFVLLLLPVGPSLAQDATDSPAPQSDFSTRVLAGGASNTLMVDIAPGEIRRLPEMQVQWPGARCDGGDRTSNVLAKRSVADDDSRTRLEVHIPAPPCSWPLYQYATITIAEGDAVYYAGTELVSVSWFPLVASLFAVGFVYPGCALIGWLLWRRRNKRSGGDESSSSFHHFLDPVQITANAYGQASLAKLQIFAFSLIVFGLLIYFQARYGVLAGLSTDVLLLLGISAVGAAGGKITHATKRRLSLDNWSWLTRHGWLPLSHDDEGQPLKAEQTPRAKWRELVTDPDQKEFDIYSFQMGVFSIVVAVALLSTNFSGIGSFEIPTELLGLLGISQTVFIGGKAVEKSAYNELDEKLTQLRAQGRKFLEARRDAETAGEALERATAVATSAPGDTTAADTATLAAETLDAKHVKERTERDVFGEQLSQAANMFWAIYGEQIRTKPQPLRVLDQVDLEAYAGARVASAQPKGLRIRKVVRRPGGQPAGQVAGQP